MIKFISSLVRTVIFPFYHQQHQHQHQHQYQHQQHIRVKAVVQNYVMCVGDTCVRVYWRKEFFVPSNHSRGGIEKASRKGLAMQESVCTKSFGRRNAQDVPQVSRRGEVAIACTVRSVICLSVGTVRDGSGRDIQSLV